MPVNVEQNKPVLAQTLNQNNIIVETTPPTNIYQTKADEPSQTSLEGMGDIKNSSIAVSNNNKVHICDTTLYIRQKIKILKEINTAIDTFILLVREIKAVIEYILSLPARLIAYFLGCLKEAYAELARQFADVVSQASGAANDATGGIIDATKDVIKATGELITNATATVAKAATAIPTALTANSTPAEKAKAEEFVTTAYSAYKPTTDFKTA